MTGVKEGKRKKGGKKRKRERWGERSMLICSCNDARPHLFMALTSVYAHAIGTHDIDSCL